MSETPWIGILVALLGGGAMGAIIKILFDLKQGRIQKIGQRLKIFPLFHHESSYHGFTAVVSVTHDGATAEYRNLFVADLTVKNRSNRDFGEFEFGVAFRGDECIHVAWEDPDQHHALSLVEPVSPSSPKSDLKLRARPFNRTDSYSVRLYLTSAREERDPRPPKLTSPYPIRFIDEVEQGIRRSKLEDHLVTLLLSMLLTGFVAGMGTYNAVLEIAQLEVVPKYKLKQAEMVSVRGPSATTLSEPDSTPTQPRSSLVPSFKLSPNAVPFPDGYDMAKPGMKLSEARLALPDGELTPGWYSVNIKSALFSKIAVSYSSDAADPGIDSVMFLFRDSASRQSVLSLVFREFGGVEHRSEALGTRLIWPDLNGFQLTITDSIYDISRPKRR